MPQSVKATAVQKKLAAAFGSVAEFDLFCLANFPEHYDEQANPQTLIEKVQRLSLLTKLGERSLGEMLRAWQAGQDGSSSAEFVPMEGEADAPAGPIGDRAALHPAAPYSPKMHLNDKDNKFEKNAKDDIEKLRLVTLQGPRLQGKSWWLQHLLGGLRSDPQHSSRLRIIEVNLAKESRSTLATSTGLFPFLHREVSQQLGLLPSELPKSSAAAEKLRDVFEILSFWRSRPEHSETNVLWSIDRLDRISDQSSEEDLLSPLRSELENTGWLTMVLCASGRGTAITGRAHRSSRDLSSSTATVHYVPDFTRAQISLLAEKYGLAPSAADLETLWRLIRGTPYLNRLAFYEWTRRRPQPFAALLAEATKKRGGGALFQSHLALLLDQLSDEDRKALTTVITSGSQEVEKSRLLELEEMGLLASQDRIHFRLRCPLYLHLAR